jgi:histone-lysine N-methyltransferase SETMAR
MMHGRRNIELGIYVLSGNQTTINAVEFNISPRPKMAHMSLSHFETMLIVFFDIQGIVMAQCVPSRQNVYRQYYIKILTKMRERVRRKGQKLWGAEWILQQDNMPAHNALPVKKYLANKNTTLLEHPPYSPDLALCDFYLFPEIKSVLKGTHFVLVENVKA